MDAKSPKSISSFSKYGRTLPNIIITGTPGTGKSYLSELLAQKTGFKHINIGELVTDYQLHDGYDSEYQTYTLNEDKLCDHLEDLLTSNSQGGHILDFHSVDFFPLRWADLVIVLTTDNTILYERLEKRKYPENKITENITAEIMMIIVNEIYQSYNPEIIMVLPSNNIDDIDQNIQKILNKLNLSI